MKKIKTVFRIDRNTKQATSEIVDESAWVLNGEGVATVKIDGTAACVHAGRLYKRYDRRPEKRFLIQLKTDKSFRLTSDMFKPAPEGFEPCEPVPDSQTGHWPGWLPVGDGPEDVWFREAWNTGIYEPGTYELVGPKVQSNKYCLDKHELWRHGAITVDVSRTYDAIRGWLQMNHHEGLVFHHPDGRMAKIRRKDFQMTW